MLALQLLSQLMDLTVSTVRSVQKAEYCYNSGFMFTVVKHSPVDYAGLRIS
jgi:hypothetical protein